MKGAECFIDLSAMTPEGEYLWKRKIQFDGNHEGTWKIRVEIVDDPCQFALSQRYIGITRPGSKKCIIGREVRPPDNTEGEVAIRVVSFNPPAAKGKLFLGIECMREKATI